MPKLLESYGNRISHHYANLALSSSFKQKEVNNEYLMRSLLHQSSKLDSLELANSRVFIFIFLMFEFHKVSPKAQVIARLKIGRALNSLKQD